MNLIIKIDKALKKHKLDPISDIINNRDKCVDYINNLLIKDKNYVSITKKTLKEELDYRVKHTLFSFGLGVYLATYKGLKAKITEKYKRYSKYPNKITFINVWLSACLYHDYGYFISDEFEGCDTLEKINVSENIFKYFDSSERESPIKSRYSEELYKVYYTRQYKFHKKNDSTEIGDHGILGGYVLFDRLCVQLDKALVEETDKVEVDFNINSYESIFKPQKGMKTYYQEFCYTIMEHNIWRLPVNKNSEGMFREITGKNFPKITDNQEPLLFLLSLVDTIEFIKKYCVYKDRDTSKIESMFPTTACRYININMKKDVIEFSVFGLNQQLKRRNINKTEDDWKDSVYSLHNWVEVVTKDNQIVKFDDKILDEKGIILE
jgi:hypothetical protein